MQVRLLRFLKAERSATLSILPCSPIFLFMRFAQLILLLCLLFCLVFPAGCKRHDRLEADSAEAKKRETERIREILQQRRGQEPKPLLRRTDQTAHEVLERMVSVYQNARSYSDHGLVQIVGAFAQIDIEPAPRPCKIVYEAPDKLRLEINDGILTSQEGQAFARIRTLPSQMLGFSSPEKWSLETIFRDSYLDQAMESGIPRTILRFPPQLILLFAEDPMRTFVPEGSVVEFLDPQRIRETPCDLVRISHPSGHRILWIGRQDSILYRFDYLVEGLSVPEGIENVASLRIELVDAKLNGKIDPTAFQMIRSDGQRLVAEFQSVEDQLLGKTFKEAESLRKIPVLFPNGSEKALDQAFALDAPDLQALVLCFWACWDDCSRGALLELQQLQKTFAEDGRVRCLAVHLAPRLAPEIMDDSQKQDDAEHPVASEQTTETNAAEKADETSNRIAEIRKSLGERNIEDAICIDCSGRLAEIFSVNRLPTWIVITPDAITQGYFRGSVTETQLSSLVREILVGGKPYEKCLDDLKRGQADHRRDLERFQSTGVYFEKPGKPDYSRGQRPAYPKIPKTFSLEERWDLRDLISPGNIVQFQRNSLRGESEKQTLLLLPCDGDSLGLIDVEGNLLDKIKPDGLMQDEMLTTVRIGTDGIGKQYVGVSSVSGHSVHVYDEDFSPVFSYRANGSTPTGSSAISGFGAQDPVPVSPRTSGRIVADFRFADVYGNGTQSLLLGVLGLDLSGNSFRDSIQAVDFFGKEIWRDDTVESPFAIDSYVDDGKRGVYALTFSKQRGTLLKLDAQGKRLKPFHFADEQHVVAFSVNDLDGDGQSELSAILSNRDNTKYRFAVLDHEGNIIGQQSVSFGEFQKTIDPIIAGDLLGDSCKEWIVFTPDGTIYIFDRMGKRIDSLAFGECLNGLVAIRLHDDRLLIAVEEDQLTAWEIVPLEK